MLLLVSADPLSEQRKTYVLLHVGGQPDQISKFKTTIKRLPTLSLFHNSGKWKIYILQENGFHCPNINDIIKRE